MKKHSHYFKPVPRGVTHIDVYRVLQMFSVTDQCLGHAMKKLLVAGGRGAGKNINQDIQEAIDSLLRWQEIQKEDSSSVITGDAVTDNTAGSCAHTDETNNPWLPTGIFSRDQINNPWLPTGIFNRSQITNPWLYFKFKDFSGRTWVVPMIQVEADYKQYLAEFDETIPVTIEEECLVTWFNEQFSWHEIKLYGFMVDDLSVEEKLAIAEQRIERTNAEIDCGSRLDYKIVEV